MRIIKEMQMYLIWLKSFNDTKLLSICFLRFFSQRKRNDSVSVVTFSISPTPRCALLPPICCRCPQMTSDPLAAAEPVWAFHQIDELWGFRKWHWLSNLAAFWLRLKLETWSASARPPLVRELLFFSLPNCFKLLAGKRPILSRPSL